MTEKPKKDLKNLVEKEIDEEVNERVKKLREELYLDNYDLVV